MMQNGNLFSAFTNEVVQFLDDRQLFDYYKEPLPSPTDETLFGYCQRFMLASAPQRQQFQEALAQEPRSLFGIYGHRAATLAARQASRDWLLSGLVGAIISNYVIPPRRNVEAGLAVFYHCAQKLGIAPSELFAEAARFASITLATRLLSFGNRADVTLSQFGWQELKTSAGVTYKFSWG
jgi:hypothetical protein